MYSHGLDIKYLGPTISSIQCTFPQFNSFSLMYVKTINCTPSKNLLVHCQWYVNIHCIFCYDGTFIKHHIMFMPTFLYNIFSWRKLHSTIHQVRCSYFMAFMFPPNISKTKKLFCLCIEHVFVFVFTAINLMAFSLKKWRWWGDHFNYIGAYINIDYVHKDMINIAILEHVILS